MKRAIGTWFAVGLAGGTFQCGNASQTLLIEQRTETSLSGRLLSADPSLEFTSTVSGALAGAVALRVGDLAYDFDYDYAAGRVVADGHARGLDRQTHRLLSGAVQLLSDYLGPENAELPLQEQMLYAALVTWQEAGGMVLDRTEFRLRTEGEEIEKSIGNDGVACIDSGLAYLASFDYGDTVVLDRAVTAGEADCNGMCGPACFQLQPWRMWTLDCLEHDECCRDTDGDGECWTPLGECGDEYRAAEADFLRGFDPFRRHCGG
jgi:hypothetical protein